MRFTKTHPIDGMSDGVATEAIADDSLRVLRVPTSTPGVLVSYERFQDVRDQRCFRETRWKLYDALSTHFTIHLG